MTQDLGTVVLKAGQTIVVTGPKPLSFHGDAKQATRVRVTAPGTYVEPVPVPPTPVQPPPTGTTREAKSIADLMSMLGDEAIDIITMAPVVWPQPTTMMLSGIRRTKPVIVKPTVAGGQIVFDGQGASGIGIRFHDGTSYIEFEDCIWQRRVLSQTGAIFFDGTLDIDAAHHIAMRRCGVRQCTGQNERNEHGIYVSYSKDGSHDVTLEDMLVDGGPGLVSPPNLSSGLHFYHSDPGNVNGHDWIVRRMTIKNTYQQVIIWDPTVRNLLFEDLRVIGVVKAANGYPGASIRLEGIPAGSNIIFRRNVLDGSVYSSDGSDQRVTFA